MTALNFKALMKAELKKATTTTEIETNTTSTTTSNQQQQQQQLTTVSASAVRDAAVASGQWQLPTAPLLSGPLPPLPDWIATHSMDAWPCAVLRDWIAPDDAAQLIRWFDTADASVLKWKRVARTRDVAMIGGAPLVDGMLPVALPVELAPLLARLAGVWGDVPANHVLVNRYDPGSGILPHTDGPLYASRVAVVSLGADATMDFGRHVDDPSTGRLSISRELSVELPANSLCVFEERLYTEFLHSIREEPPTGDTHRISLTIRVVQRVCRKESNSV
jgi:hypothetical protein